MTVHAFPSDPAAAHSRSRSRYPSGHAGAAGSVDAAGNVHDITGRFAGHAQEEGTTEVINAADGTFYFPPNFKDATVEEYLDFWMNVPVPDEALVRFLAAHRAERAKVPDAGEDYPEEIPWAWARHYARATNAAGMCSGLPEADQEKVLSHRIDVDYQDGGDTIGNFVDRYRTGGDSALALDPPEAEADRLARLEQQLSQIMATVNRVEGTVNLIEETVDEIDEGVDEVKGGLDDVEEEVAGVHRTARLIDATVAPRGTYNDGTKSRWRRRQKDQQG